MEVRDLIEGRLRQGSRQPDSRPGVDERANPAQCTGVGAKPTVCVVPFGRRRIETHLERDRPTHLDQRPEPLPAGSAQQHRVRQERQRETIGHVFDELGQVGPEGGFTASQEHADHTRCVSFIDQRADPVGRQAPRIGARARDDAAVVTGEVAVEVRVHPEARWHELLDRSSFGGRIGRGDAHGVGPVGPGTTLAHVMGGPAGSGAVRDDRQDRVSARRFE